jgi:hypothetical protein
MHSLGALKVIQREGMKTLNGDHAIAEFEVKQVTARN